MEGFFWKVTLLSGLLAATLALAVPRLVRENDYIRFTVASTGVDILAIPTAALLAFYLIGWQVAVIIAVAGAVLWRSVCRAVVDARFPNVTRTQHHGGPPIARYVLLTLCAFIVAFDVPQYLRAYPFVFVAMASFHAVRGRFPERFYRAFGGVERIAFPIAAWGRAGEPGLRDP